MDWSIKSWGWENQDLINGKENESSISASIGSSSKSAVKISGFDFDSVEDFSIGLKLGKRTNFEDVCAGNNTKNSTSLTPVTSSAALVKKKRVIHQNILNSQCQVEGCGEDLSRAKDYHRKHRVCESHSKCPKVVVGGEFRRFCQQCSRFHDLSEFDQKKRSCRKRLSDHNARRRKPPSQIISFNSPRLASRFYGVEALMHASNFDGMPDIQFAHSLLSTHSWGSLNPDQSILSNYGNTMDSASASYWHSLAQQEQVLPFDFHNNGKAPHESSFFDSSQIISKTDGHFQESKTCWLCP